ncbi:MAG: S-methyl-5'-thioinosine phosphorylase [Pseudomonadales bacterium]
MSECRSLVAIIGGTGLNDFQQGRVAGERQTPFGETSADIIVSAVADQPLAFLARHGRPHSISPHKINYRANLWALKQLGVEQVIAVNAVGGIHTDLPAGSIVIPDQLIDYTYGREHTFFDGGRASLEHIDFTYPFTESLRGQLVNAAHHSGITVVDTAVYGAVQGPRLETVAEVNRLEKDGCDIIGMTAMPEAALARELSMDYASLCLVVNPAAGRSEILITMTDIHAVIDTGMIKVRKLLTAMILEKAVDTQSTRCTRGAGPRFR